MLYEVVLVSIKFVLVEHFDLLCSNPGFDVFHWPFEGLNLSSIVDEVQQVDQTETVLFHVVLQFFIIFSEVCTLGLACCFGAFDDLERQVSCNGRVYRANKSVILRVFERENICLPIVTQRLHVLKNASISHELAVILSRYLFEGGWLHLSRQIILGVTGPHGFEADESRIWNLCFSSVAIVPDKGQIAHGFSEVD